jgi:VIT1/CCC1 family predicted Fe2+/Mn2+ transporter
MARGHAEHHLVQRMGWLRAAVLGANDGIISTSSLILGVASAASGAAGHQQALVAGFAGLVAGAMSMAAGEYVSVSSQSDTEQADLARESAELKDDPEREQTELAQIYEKRGLDPALARQVAKQLMGHNALEAHARDELGISDATTARPIQAAIASAASFTGGAAGPLALVYFSPASLTVPIVAGGSLVFLAVLGMVGALAGGAGVLRPIIRVVFWGALAMALTTGIGALVGTAV